MRASINWLAVAAVAALGLVGCAGPEKKLGRGLENLSEATHCGEWRRSMEQTALWYGPEAAYTRGAISGFNRTILRTLVGVYEVATFPIPDPHYGPRRGMYNSTPPLYMDKNRYPDNYRPNLLEDQLFAPDTSLGFAGGDVAPFIPGSRFRIFDN